MDKEIYTFDREYYLSNPVWFNVCEVCRTHPAILGFILKRASPFLPDIPISYKVCSLECKGLLFFQLDMA